MKVHISVTGKSPLMLHNEQLANPANKFAKMLKVFSKKRVKTDEDHEQMAHIEFLGGLYLIDEEGKTPYVKSGSLLKSLIEGAKLGKQGKQLMIALTMVGDKIPLIYEGPKEAEKLWEDKSFVDQRMVRVEQSRILRTRPIFREWGLECDALLNTAILDLQQLRDIATNAGMYCNLGENRPGGYGHYEATVTEVKEANTRIPELAL
jgi:hypothetical protein